MVDKLYRFHWRDGSTNDGPGETPETALSLLGFGRGALPALDYFEELPSPSNEKPGQTAPPRSRKDKTMTVHTPGSWRICKMAIKPKYSEFCIATITPTRDNEETGKANARLIAAAPELLGMLQQMIILTDATVKSRDFALSKMSQVPDEARKIVAKARGDAK